MRSMSLTPGARLGPYEILSAVGAGGMGEVYKAADTRLNRTVAIKVLPAHFSEDPEMKERFEREARTIASLNHPHICVLHDIGRQDGIDFLVMEYLDGKTLASRIERGGPLPLADALKTAIEIADALDKAHRQSVVHRDIKPSNVILTKTGTKLLDFGLAKLRQLTPPSHVVSTSLPTRMDDTTPGVILGTLQYMAPEQLEGKDADARTDIFAFGLLLYEMLTGRKAFEGKSQASLIGAIMTTEPPPVSKALSPSPPALDHGVKKCLAKDPEERWQSAKDLMAELQWTSETHVTTAALDRPRKNASAWMVPLLSMAVIVLAVIAF